jgi:hypothetical protein
MRVFGRRIVVCSAVVFGIARPARAQSTDTRDAYRWALGVAADLGGLPDALSKQCGDGSGVAHDRRGSCRSI